VPVGFGHVTKARRGKALVLGVTHASSPTNISNWRSVRHSMTFSQYGAILAHDRVPAVPVGRRLGVQPVHRLRAVFEVGDHFGVGLVVVVARVARMRIVERRVTSLAKRSWKLNNARP